ncbi:MAG: alpha/beta fold hydrolase [Kiloniellaceae bacterium]
MPEEAGAFRERTFSAQDGLRLYYRDYGDPLATGTPLVCLCGLTRNSKDFHDLARRLARDRRVICPDYRGRGRSAYDPQWRNYTPQVVLNDVIQLLAASNLHHVVICGTSFGGLLAMSLAVAAPMALAGVILNDVGPELNRDGTQRILDYVSRDRPQPNWAAAIAEIKRFFPALSLASEDDWRRFTEATFREGEDGRLHFDWDVALARPLVENRIPKPDLWPLYRALRHRPVLAIRGGLSDVLSAETFARMAAEKPDLIQVTLPDVGHVPTLNEPEAERAIDDFLARIDG